MMLHRRWFAPAVALVCVLGAACSSGDSDPDAADDAVAATTETTDARAADTFTGNSPTEIVPPPAEGKGITLPQPAAGVPDGYVQEEYFIGGSATSFEAEDTPTDGAWTASPTGEAEYRTRVIVRRPADPAAFSGTVVVEWFNVSAIEASPDWGYLSEEIGREGHAYVGVSAQAQGVEGGETLFDVDVDAEQAAAADVETDKSGLKNTDPDRYGTLVHPGDAYAFDIFTQVGRAVTGSPEKLLGGLRPEQVIAAGESQSAIFLSTVVNAVHPLDPVFDGFLIHSRGAFIAPLDGKNLGTRERLENEDAATEGIRIRTDLDVPVMILEAETDLTLLAYKYARQDDTDLIRTWEVAGTSHADAQTLRAVIGGPRDPGIGSLLGCSSINTGPHKEALAAAFHHLVGWTAGGDAPPTTERLEMVDGDDPVIVRDERGNALGGVRNPLVDVPVATLTGEPPTESDLEELGSGNADLCLLFGETIPFDQATLVELYGSADAYVQQFRASAAEAVAAGTLLQPDADELISDAEGWRSLFP